MTIGICDYVTYVLELENGCYYVGKSKTLHKRLTQHFTGDGAAKWTKLHKPIKVLDIIETNVEEETTLKYMKQYGIKFVRGFSWCHVVLSEYGLNNIKNKLSLV
jgi:predicted GIY-YIG superfamily endonuclease